MYTDSLKKLAAEAALSYIKNDSIIGIGTGSTVNYFIVKLGGFPIYREHVVTDNGNAILDVQHLEMNDPVKVEWLLNNITGVVCNGLFAQHTADILLVGSNAGIKTIE